MRNDRAANDVYFARCDHELRNRFRRHHLNDVLRIPLDVLYRTLVGYGVHPERLLFIALPFLIAGAMIFDQPGAVNYRDLDQRRTDPAQIDLDRLDATLVSLDQLLPIDVPSANRWEPSDTLYWQNIGISLTYSDFAAAETILGWISVPIVIATLAGVLRRESH
jgi:hypothetical protein